MNTKLSHTHKKVFSESRQGKKYQNKRNNCETSLKMQRSMKCRWWMDRGIYCISEDILYCISGALPGLFLSRYLPLSAPRNTNIIHRFLVYKEKKNYETQIKNKILLQKYEFLNLSLCHQCQLKYIVMVAGNKDEPHVTQEGAIVLQVILLFVWASCAPCSWT